ncbi:MAG: DUF11 domain-containing protein [Clostridium sp.]
MEGIFIEKTSTLEYINLDTTNRINYTIIIENNSDSIINTVRVYDIPEPNQKLIRESVLIDNQPPGESLLLEDNSIIISSINPKTNSIITFDVEVSTVNPPNKIISKATAMYLDVYGNIYSIVSNECIVEVIYISVYIPKEADRSTANIGDSIGYKVFIKNNSNVPIRDVTFFDPWPEELDLVNDCLLVNGVETYKNLEELAQGVFLNILNPNESVIITFYGTVLKEPPCSILPNRAYINFEYVVPDPKLANRFIKKREYSNYADVRIIS